MKLNRKFYSREAISQAISDFSEVCDARISDDSFTVEIRPKEEIDDLEKEFSNYVLGLMQNE